MQQQPLSSLAKIRRVDSELSNDYKILLQCKINNEYSDSQWIRRLRFWSMETTSWNRLSGLIDQDLLTTAWLMTNGAWFNLDGFVLQNEGLPWRDGGSNELKFFANESSDTKSLAWGYETQGVFPMRSNNGMEAPGKRKLPAQKQ